jgi:hypothetical protein
MSANNTFNMDRVEDNARLKLSVGHQTKMATKLKTWTAKHFSQANPIGRSQGDVASLLRRVAGSLEKIGPIEVQDLILHTDVTADGPQHSLTVYFHRSRSRPAKNRKSSKGRASK